MTKLHCNYATVLDDVTNDGWVSNAEPRGFMATVEVAKRECIHDYCNSAKIDPATFTPVWINVQEKGVHFRLMHDGKHVAHVTCRKISEID